ncbi:methyltransferase domain-containing protein [Bacillus sp. FJAT-50079]|nr:class I SAM-dependent methyltransferase [Bacillus sp. FJAT-50079]MBS4209427.1 methyltransferase domain-containing protein [Bacillus sp. FJAT-50079]
MDDQWNAHLYDRKHAFVSQYGESLIDLLAPMKGEKILDLGCGTGDLAKRLSDLDTNIIGVDQSENMVNQALNKYPNLSFQVQNALDLPYNNEFDAVFSNATLHWIKPPERVLHSIFNSLKKGGRLVAEFGGIGNVQSITEEMIHQIEKLGMEYDYTQFPWYFPSIGEYTALMEKIGFHVTFAHHFARPTPLEGENGLRNWITMFADNLLAGFTEEKKEIVIENAEKRLKHILYVDGQWIADYKRIRVIGVKVQ